jgi:hypothetical protein
MEAIRSSETSGDKISTRCHIPEDGILRLLPCSQKLTTASNPEPHEFSPSNNNLIREEIKSNTIREVLATSQFIIFCLPACCQSINIGIYKIVIIHVVLFWCETWSIALMQEQKLRVLENRVVRRIFRPKRDEIL